MITLKNLYFASQLLHLSNSHLFEHGLFCCLSLDAIDFLGFDTIDLIHELGRVRILAHDVFETLVFVSQRLDDLVQVNALQQLHLTGHALQVIQALHLCRLELNQFVLFDLLQFHLVPEALQDLILGRVLVLDFHKLLLKDLLTLLSLCQLLPQHRIAAQLLLHIVHLVVELLLLDCLFQLLQHP